MTLPRKPKKKRAFKTPRCVRQRCGKAQLHDGLCKKHLTWACDDMARALKRQEVTACSRCGSEQSLQWSHHFSRRFMRLRLDPLNATMHCAPCHAYLTHNPFAHAAWIRDHVGEFGWFRLYHLAYDDPEPFKSSDLIDWYDRLKKEVA